MPVLMEFTVNIPAGTRQRQFLDYLNAAVREHTGSFYGETGADEMGNLTSALVGPFSLGTVVIRLR